MNQKREELETFKQALWEFILEHSEILESGAMFVKFHAKDRYDIEKRIKARWKYNFHRENVVLKEAAIAGMRNDWEKEKQEKKQRYEKNKDRGRRKLFWSKLLGKIGIRI